MLRAPREEPTMRLYSGPLSLFTAKVRIALEEKGLAYERVEVGWSLARRYEPHHPDVVRLNPKRQVPVLVDGDVVVYDSTQIFEYLEDLYPEPPLYPRDVAARARCRRLEAAADEILFPPLWDLIEEAFYPPAAGARDGARLAGARATWAQLQAGLDAELAGSDYLCGAFSVADIASFVMANAAATLGAPPDPRLESLGAWLARMRARPAVARDVDAMTRFVAKLLAPAQPQRTPAELAAEA
jgi:glutathione S-transferase